MIRSFGGINLATKDVKSLVHFYKDILEMPIINEGYGNYDGVQFGFSDKEPGFWIWDENKWGAATNKANLVFFVDDLDSLYERISNKGITCEPPITTEWGGKSFRLLDPCGNELEFLVTM
ncbi:MAG: VOC family protein [Clostridiales bacterium]|nr:VOC family protein [Clostridiales bacterium]